VCVRNRMVLHCKVTNTYVQCVPALACRQDLEARLSQLAAKLAALRSSFALIQDMVDLPGLSVWHAELSRVISANLAAEMRR